MTSPTTHPFQQAGLGLAPFRFRGLVDQGEPNADGMVSCGRINGLEMWTKPGGTCAYCGTYILKMFMVESADGKIFHVGCDCIEKAHPGWTKQAKKAVRDHRKSVATTGRLKAERLANEAAGLGPLTNAEVRKAQVEAQRAEQLAAYEAQVAADKAKKAASKHIGTVGERVDLVLTLEGRPCFDGAYGTTYIHLMRDSEGNSVVYKSSAFLKAAKGETFKLRATIKAHSDYNGENQTLVARAQLIA